MLVKTKIKVFFSQVVSPLKFETPRSLPEQPNFIDGISCAEMRE